MTTTMRAAVKRTKLVLEDDEPPVPVPVSSSWSAVGRSSCPPPPPPSGIATKPTDATAAVIMDRLYEDSRAKSRWHWLLAPDGSFATATAAAATDSVLFGFENHHHPRRRRVRPRRRNPPFTTTTTTTTPQDFNVAAFEALRTTATKTVVVSSSIVPNECPSAIIDGEDDDTLDRDRRNPSAGGKRVEEPKTPKEDSPRDRSLPRRNRTWCWLLNPDGRHATIEAARDRRSSFRGSGIHPGEERPRRRPPLFFRGSGIHLGEERRRPRPPLAVSDGSGALFSSSVDRNPADFRADTAIFDEDPSIRAAAAAPDPRSVPSSTVRAPPKRASSSWRWLLEPDGRFATAGRSPSSAASLRTGDDDPSGHTAAFGEAVAAGVKRKLRTGDPDAATPPPIETTWFWLLTPDGRPAFGDTKDGDDDEGFDTDADGYLKSNSEFEDDDDDESCEFFDESDQERANSHPVCTVANDSKISSKKFLYCEKRWESKYQLLVKYKNEHGTTRVPNKDPILGKWVMTQRCCYKRNKLWNHRIQRLNSIGFDWRIQTYLPWMEMYNRLLSYKSRHNGSTNVPIRYRADKRLGRWVERQRKYYKMGKLKQQRKNLLRSIGFVWQLKDPNHWMDMHERLVAYKRKHGTTSVSSRWKEDPQLANWVNAQRHYCKKQNRIDLLNEIGFNWGMTQSDRWMDMYERLVAYKNKYGTASVPFKWKEDPQLARWVRKQRKACKEQDRIDLLNEIGFVWQTKDPNR